MTDNDGGKCHHDLGKAIRERYGDFLTGGPFDGPQAVEDVKVLLALLDRVTALLILSLRSNVMCRHRLATTAQEVAEHLRECTDANGAIVAHQGSADISTMLGAGWTLDSHVEFLAGKRIRILHRPAHDPGRSDGARGVGMEAIAAVDDGAENGRNLQGNLYGNPWGESHG